MNFLNHRQRTPGHVLEMPEGLQELLSDISREVLRCQPSVDCVYKFIADYLEAMVKARDNHKIAMEIIEEAILRTDEVYSQFAKCNIPKDKTNSFLDVMELTFRRFVDKKRQKNHYERFIKFHPDDMLEELIKKCDLTKVEVLRSRPAIQWAYKKFVKTYLAAIEGTLDTEDLYIDTEKLLSSTRERDQMRQSAIKIQKVYRGYKTRKSLKENQLLKFAVHESSEDSSSDSSFREFILGRQEEMTKAAIKIQASFKGFYVRKKNPLDAKKVSLRPYNPAQSVAKVSSLDSLGSLQDSAKDEEMQKPSTDATEMSQPEDEADIIQTRQLRQSIASQDQYSEQETLEDPHADPQDLNEAAVKIQASFKGYRVRKEMSQRTKTEEFPNTPEEQRPDESPEEE